MTTAEKHEFWTTIETDLRSLLDGLAARISKKDIDDVAEYLDHNELGLALEVLCHRLHGHQSAVSLAEFKRIRELFGRMGMADSTFLAPVESLVARE